MEENFNGGQENHEERRAYASAMCIRDRYDEGGLEGLARADAEIQNVLPEGVDLSLIHI